MTDGSIESENAYCQSEKSVWGDRNPNIETAMFPTKSIRNREIVAILAAVPNRYDVGVLTIVLM